MALSIQRIWGFNTGETSALGGHVSSGSPSFTPSNLDDSWSDYAISLTSSYTVSPNYPAGDGGGEVHWGYKFKASALPSSRIQVAECENSSGTNNWRCYLETDGDLTFEDNGGTTQIRTDPISANAWYKIEVYAKTTATQDFQVKVSGVGEYTAASFTHVSAGTRLTFYGGAGNTHYFDSCFWATESGAWSWLGDWTVDAVRHDVITQSFDRAVYVSGSSSTASLTGVGTMDDAQETPWVTSGTSADLSGTADAQGYGGVNDCDGPGTQNYGTGAAIHAAAIHCCASRGNGSGTTHALQLTQSNVSTPDQATYGQSITLDSSAGFFSYTWDSTNTRCPTISEDVASGFWKDDGGRDFECFEILAEVLIELPAPPTSFPPVDPSRQAYRHMLVR